jgi:hypothetical protein
MLESAAMEVIRDLIEWVGNDGGTTAATLFPFALLGLSGLYVLWLIVGYLRVSQVGVNEASPAGPVLSLPERAEDEAAPVAPRGVPYCPVDRLAYPAGARFCTVCERDLTLDCTNCGATVQASETSCYRCGTPTGTPAEPLLT